MRINYFGKILFLLLGTAALVGCVTDTPETIDVTGGTITLQNDVPEMQSAGVMTFAEDNALLVADYQSGTIFAFNISRGSAPLLFVPYNIVDVDLQIAALLGTTVDQIYINDMVVHPVNSSAYLSVMVGEGDAAQPAIFTVTHTGLIEMVNLGGTAYTSVTINRMPDAELVFENNIPARSLGMTDIDYYNGELFVSGLSSAEQSAEIRRIPYPFDGTVSYISTEIYHTSYDQIESRSPIYTQSIVETEGGPVLLAAYAGTPLVTFPLSDLQDGAHVKGKTIVELGYGSRPIDLLPYSEFGTDKLMVTTTGYNALTLGVDEILVANAGGGLTTSVEPGLTAGAEPFTSALNGVQQVSELDFAHLLMLRRNRITGNLDLVSTVKSVFFRLSDFQSEYDSVGYSYPDDGSQRMTKLFHNVFRLNEGHRDEVVLP